MIFTFISFFENGHIAINCLYIFMSSFLKRAKSEEQKRKRANSQPWLNLFEVDWNLIDYAWLELHWLSLIGVSLVMLDLSLIDYAWLDLHWLSLELHWLCLIGVMELDYIFIDWAWFESSFCSSAWPCPSMIGGPCQSYVISTSSLLFLLVNTGSGSDSGFGPITGLLLMYKKKNMYFRLGTIYACYFITIIVHS